METEWKWMDTRGISFSHPPSLSPSALISSACGKYQGASRGLSVSNPNPSLCLRNGWLSLAQETGLPHASIGLLIKYKIFPLSSFLLSLSPSFSSSLSVFSVSEDERELPRSLGPAFVWRAVERSGILEAYSKGGGSWSHRLDGCSVSLLLWCAALSERPWWRDRKTINQLASKSNEPVWSSWGGRQSGGRSVEEIWDEQMWRK